MDQPTKPQAPAGAIGSVKIHNVRVGFIPRRARTKASVFLKCDEFPEGRMIPSRVIDPLDLKKIAEAFRRKGSGDREVGSVRMLKWWFDGMQTGKFEPPAYIPLQTIESGVPVRPRTSPGRTHGVPDKFMGNALSVRKAIVSGALDRQAPNTGYGAAVVARSKK